MGNSAASIRESIESSFDVQEIEGSPFADVAKRTTLISEGEEGETNVYFVTSKGVDLHSVKQNGQKKPSQNFHIGEDIAPITHSLLLRTLFKQSKEINQESEKSTTLLVIILADSKLSVLQGSDLHLMKTIQLFAPLEAFKISLIHDLKFSIKEDLLHKTKQAELLENLIAQKKEFKKFFPDASDSPSKDDLDATEVRPRADQLHPVTVSNENSAEYNEYMKAQYEIFVAASRMVSKDLLDIAAISDCHINGRGVVLVGYKCGLVQKVTVDRANIEVTEECIFFNPLNLKSQSELELIVKSAEATVEVEGEKEKVVAWNDFNVFPLRDLFCVNGGTYVITVHEEVDEECNNTNFASEIIRQERQRTTSSTVKVERQRTLSNMVQKSERQRAVSDKALQPPQQQQGKQSSSSSFSSFSASSSSVQVYVYEYQNGKKISYFDATCGAKIKKAFVNENEATNRNILYLLDAANVLSLFNFERGSFIQSFNLDTSLKIADVKCCFFRKPHIFARVDEVFPLLEPLEEASERIVEGDLLFFFTEDSKILVTQLDYKLQNATTNNSSSSNTTGSKKFLNQRALKILTPKIPCQYNTSVYSQQMDRLLVTGKTGNTLSFTNFVASIYYHLS